MHKWRKHPLQFVSGGNETSGVRRIAAPSRHVSLIVSVCGSVPPDMSHVWFVSRAPGGFVSTAERPPPARGRVHTGMWQLCFSGVNNIIVGIISLNFKRCFMCQGGTEWQIQECYPVGFVISKTQKPGQISSEFCSESLFFFLYRKTHYLTMKICNIMITSIKQKEFILSV